MHPSRILTAATAAATALALAAVAPVADAPRPVVKLTAAVWPKHLPIADGTPLKLRLNTTFASAPRGANFVLQHADYLFGRGAKINWKLFPTCSAARLRASGGALDACPKGSKKYAFKLSATVPDELKTVLGGDIVVSRLDVTTGATRMVNGVRRGYFEAKDCPAKGSAIHGDFTFDDGVEASADTSVVC